MSDLIDRQAAIDAVTGWETEPTDAYYPSWYVEKIKELPSAEPQERKGEWQITDAYPHNVYCSKCHKRFAQTHWTVWEDGSLPRNFCPNCGARMETKQILSEADNDTAYGGMMSAT